MMKINKLAAATVAALTLSATALVAPAATAQSGGAGDLISTGSAASSGGSSSGDSETFPDDYQTNPDFQQGEPVKTSSGSSPVDTFLIFGGVTAGVAILAKLVTDNNPALRAQVDELAKQVGLQRSSGSSESNRLYGGGLDFNLERLARTNGMPELADQIAALSSGSNQPTPAPAVQ